MHRPALALALAIATSCGCGGGLSPSEAASLPSKPGAHGGTAFALPDGAGYVEVVIENVSKAKKGRMVVVAAYFLKPDLAAPLDPAPTGVSAKMTVPGSAEPVTLALAAKPIKEGDGRFASEVGEYDFDEIRGELTATVGSKEATVPFAIR